MSFQCLWKCYSQQKHHYSPGKKSDGFSNSKAELHDLPCSGHPIKAVSPVKLQHADAIIRKH